MNKETDYFSIYLCVLLAPMLVFVTFTGRQIHQLTLWQSALFVVVCALYYGMSFILLLGCLVLVIQALFGV